MREVKRLQRKLNGGRKWDGVPAGTLRPGAGLLTLVLVKSLFNGVTTGRDN